MTFASFIQDLGSMCAVGGQAAGRRGGVVLGREWPHPVPNVSISSERILMLPSREDAHRLALTLCARHCAVCPGAQRGPLSKRQIPATVVLVGRALT